MATHRYGRGKFKAHPNYINYMHYIVEHASYAGMPNAVGQSGRINWQVSSGKTTSFYQDYLARKQWWANKLDEVGLVSPEGEQGLLTTIARLIHPTGYRPCRLCGKEFSVGYFYLNSLLAKKINKFLPTCGAHQHDAIPDIIERLRSACPAQVVDSFILDLFPERKSYFETHGIGIEAFEASRHLGSIWLSPGFMGNPPDRLDGFHDYDVTCRKKNDPGRSDENMRSYNHDRRTFEWWAEGDWAVADALYNSAAAGACAVSGCQTKLNKVSPDHVGPLACGFKQMPLFEPTCQSHNSSKNRRFTHSDVALLIAYERETGDSAASWQVRAHWDKWKEKISSDDDALALSNSMRSLQDMYLRVLAQLALRGFQRFLTTLLRPECALEDIRFTGLDGGALRFAKVIISQNTSPMRIRQTARVVRIAFEALAKYEEKATSQRKLARADYSQNELLLNRAIASLPPPMSISDKEWQQAFQLPNNVFAWEDLLLTLMVDGRAPSEEEDAERRAKLKEAFDHIGSHARMDFSRYQVP